MVFERTNEKERDKSLKRYFFSNHSDHQNSTSPSPPKSSFPVDYRKPQQKRTEDFCYLLHTKL